MCPNDIQKFVFVFSLERFFVQAVCPFYVFLLSRSPFPFASTYTPLVRPKAHVAVLANGQQGSYREETRFSHYRKVIDISALLTIQSQTRRSCLRFPFSPARELVGPRRRQVFSLPAKAGQTRRGRFPLRPLKQWRTGWALHLAALLNELS